MDEKQSYTFNTNIYDLEVRKARLILESRSGGEEWEEILNKTSDHSVLIGWVDFLLDFSDEKFEYKSYKGKRKLTYKNPNLEKFKQYASLTMSIFDMNFLDSKENLTLFRRAFLCIGNYGFYSRNWFYGNIPLDLYRDREAMNWILSGVKNDKKMPYFRKFLDRLIKSGANEHNLKEQMEKIIDSTDLSNKEWWEQLLIIQKEIFDFINKKEKFQKYGRIRFFDKDSQARSKLDQVNITKVELLPGSRNTKNVRCLLDFAFYHYCKTKLKDDVSEYECDEEQYGYSNYPPKSHFKIKGKDVFCDSRDFKITIDNNEPFKLNIEKGNKILEQFDTIVDKIRCLQ